MKCTIKILCLNHPETIPPTPGPWNNCLPWTQFLVPKSWGPLIYRMWALILRSVYARLAHSRLGVVRKGGVILCLGTSVSLCYREGRLERGYSCDWEEAVVSGSAQEEVWYMVRGTVLPGWSELVQNAVVFLFCLSVSCTQMSLSDADLLWDDLCPTGEQHRRMVSSSPARRSECTS